MSTLEESTMLIHLSNENVINFQECCDGIYYYNMLLGADSKNSKTKYNSSVTNFHTNPLSKFVATVQDNKDFFTKNDIERANVDQKLQEHIGWPITQFFKSYIDNNLLLNYSTTADDIDRVIKIYGAPRTLLQGKMI